jgi:hypothetical protein
MFCRSEAEGLCLGFFVRMQASLNLTVANDDDGQYDAEERGAHDDDPREADRVEHDIPKAGDFIALNDFHYDRCTGRLHASIVLQA